jgi:hypothetical protein
MRTVTDAAHLVERTVFSPRKGANVGQTPFHERFEPLEE